MKNKKGFTLAELLIVVAIIAVLVAIAIPIFSAQLEKSREATDMANIRSAFAQVVAEALSTDGQDQISARVTLVQQQDKWQTVETSADLRLGGQGLIQGTFDTEQVNIVGEPMQNNTCDVIYNAPTASDPATVSIVFNGNG
ncbi:MAG: prepilin-type N-terminal cleavage/methylation domain-containing protein [Oscillospiraceae bacterium]|nr:prepilin-type N-terminal cleavage/methylation domain-containing protein [Oscillospiraceae bacterium]